jgi:hypothetical protein
MQKRALRALFLALTCVAATAHCGKGTDSGPQPLGPTDVVVAWTFDGKPASAAECMARGGVQVSITLSATNDPALHQNAKEACEKGTVTFAALDTGGLGMPFLEGALLDDKGMTVRRADVTVTPTAGKTPVTLDFFAAQMTTGATTGDTTVTTGDTTSATSGGGVMGGMGGGTATSAASSSASSAASASASSSASGAGGADAGP